MGARLVALLALLALAASALHGQGAPPGAPEERVFVLEVTAVPCPQQKDGVCLAYNGQIPGPTLDVNVGDTLVVHLHNNISSTIRGATADDALAARLAASAVSWHVHGTAVPNDMDGIDGHEGTNLVRSVAEPGGVFTYRTRAAFAGAWHYHDHVLGFDGSEGVDRGLFGGLVVRNGAEPRPDVVVDLHVLDEGANGGRAIAVPAAAGQRAEVLVVGLENFVWNVEVRDPSGAKAYATRIGPGMSERFGIDALQPGAYTWRASGPLGAKSGALLEVAP